MVPVSPPVVPVSPPIMSSSSEENLASAGGGKTYPQVCAALVACLGAFLMGTGIGWSAPALNQLMMNDTAQPFVVTQTDANWIGSLTPAGALFGSERQLKLVRQLAFFKLHTLWKSEAPRTM